jgi:anthranilate phosphoribosyltransferase
MTGTDGTSKVAPVAAQQPAAGERPVFAALLEKLARREDLTQAEAAQALWAMAEGRVGESEMAAFLMGLRVKGETAEEIAGLVETMRKAVVPVRTESPRSLVDIVGTGGDGLGTFNISTTAAFVVAGAGVKVAKHGNRAASSRCGSADLLEALGVRLDLEPHQIAQCIDRVGLGFMLAPRHHPATGRVAGVRRSLGIRTVFNLLGPLTNPAGAGRLLLGVGVPQSLPVLAQAVARLDCERALVVSGQEGMDEMSVTGPTTVIEVKQGVTSRPYVLEPAECGLQEWPLAALAGGDAAHNARLTRAVLGGEAGAPREAVLLNAGAALYVAGVSSSIREGVALARETLDSGRALAVLERLVAFTRSAAARDSSAEAIAQLEDEVVSQEGGIAAGAGGGSQDLGQGASQE